MRRSTASALRGARARRLFGALCPGSQQHWLAGRHLPLCARARRIVRGKAGQDLHEAERGARRNDARRIAPVADSRSSDAGSRRAMRSATEGSRERRRRTRAEVLRFHSYLRWLAAKAVGWGGVRCEGSVGTLSALVARDFPHATAFASFDVPTCERLRLRLRLRPLAETPSQACKRREAELRGSESV